MTRLPILQESKGRTARRAALAVAVLYSAVSVWHASHADGERCRSGPFPRSQELKLYPGQATAATGFNVQPDGRSAIAVEGTCFTIAHSVYWDENRLETVWQDSKIMTAAIPPELIARPGRVTISVRDFRRPERPEMIAPFALLPPTGEPR
jgi:hypothetical protein